MKVELITDKLKHNADKVILCFLNDGSTWPCHLKLSGIITTFPVIIAIIKKLNKYRRECWERRSVIQGQ